MISLAVVRRSVHPHPHHGLGAQLGKLAVEVNDVIEEVKIHRVKEYQLLQLSKCLGIQRANVE